MPNGKANLKPGANERHGGYLLVNRGIVRESNADIATAMEQLTDELVAYVGGEPDTVQALLIDAIVPTFGFRKLIERHCWRSGVLVQEGKRVRVAPALKDTYFLATNSMVRAAKALGETVANNKQAAKTIDLAEYLRRKAEAGEAK